MSRYQRYQNGEEYDSTRDMIMRYRGSDANLLLDISSPLSLEDTLLLLDRISPTTREGVFTLFGHNLFFQLSVNEARQVADSLIGILEDGDVLAFDEQKLHFVKDDGIMKLLPQDSFRNFDTVVPMYLVSKYRTPELAQLRNTSLFMIESWGAGSVAKYQYREVLDPLILNNLQNRGDFTDAQLLSVDYNAIVFAAMENREGVLVRQ